MDTFACTLLLKKQNPTQVTEFTQNKQKSVETDLDIKDSTLNSVLKQPLQLIDLCKSVWGIFTCVQVFSYFKFD